jgi:hypothetical protein
MLEMRPRIDKDQQKAVISRFSLYLEELERLLAVKYGPRAEDLGIANPYISSVDMVGWSLGKLTDEDVKPQDLHQDPNAVSSEAQLETSECRLEFVQEEDLGRFRGKPRRRCLDGFLMVHRYCSSFNAVSGTKNRQRDGLAC